MQKLLYSISEKRQLDRVGTFPTGRIRGQGQRLYRWIQSLLRRVEGDAVQMAQFG